jgi:hypothetical protein
MRRRHFLAVGAATAVVGCSGSLGGERYGRLDLTVQNDRADAVTVQVEVVDAEGLNYELEETRIESGVSEAFEIAVGADDRHEATVTGDDWRGQLAWNVDTCFRFRGTVRVTSEAVEVASECAQRR